MERVRRLALLITACLMLSGLVIQPANAAAAESTNPAPFRDTDPNAQPTDTSSSEETTEIGPVTEGTVIIDLSDEDLSQLLDN